MHDQPIAKILFDYQIELNFDRKAIIPCMIAIYREQPIPTDTIKMGFFGAAGEPDLDGRVGGVSEESIDFARRTGLYVGYHNKHHEPKILPVTGAAPGNPHAFTEEAARHGTWSIGLSPFYDEESHLSNGSFTNSYAAIVYMGLDKLAGFQSPEAKNRMNVQFGIRDGYNILGIHFAVYVSGTDGTNQELATNKMIGKDFGLARGVGGVSQHYPDYERKIGRNTGSRIVISRDPRYMVKRLVKLQVEKEEGKGKRQRLFIDDIVDRINRELEN